MAKTNPIIQKLLKLTALDRYPDDSLEVMIYIICLIMFADKRIRKGELVTLNSRGPGTLLSTFQDSFDSINSGDFENIQFSLKYSEINLVNILEELKTNAKKDYNWFPSELLLYSAAKKITDVDKQRLTLLGAIRIAACDLHLSPTEDKFLKKLAASWQLEKMLLDVMSKLPDWENKRTLRLIKKVNHFRGQFQTMIENGSISQRAYNRIEKSIADNEPKLELYNELKEMYDYAEHEVESLESEKKELLQQTENLADDLKKAQSQLKRLSPNINDKKSVEVIFEQIFNKLEFHSSSIKVFLNDFPDKRHILDCLNRLNNSESMSSKRVYAAKEWKEISKIRTGNPEMYRMGRVYYKLTGKENNSQVKVLINVKKNESDQQLTMKNLRNWH